MARFYRTWAGPAIIGASVWCAAGTVAVLSSTDAANRVVALAPWWIGVAAAAVAACVPGWRARPASALPALFATVPWWPVPVPEVALIWTGVLAWVPIGVALLVAEGGRWLSWLGQLAGSGRRSIRLAAAGSALIAIAGAWADDPHVPSGDEPHYLVITQSLLKDGDLKIENNHASRDYAAYFEGTLDPHYIVPGRDGAIYSIHAPGVSAIVLPGFALLGFRGAQLTLILLFALTGALIWSTAWRLTDDPSAAWFAWAAIAGSTTMAVLSFMVFPDAPGACLVAMAAWLFVTHRSASARSLMLVSAAIAVLPWLHTRFSVLAGVLGVVLVGLLMTDQSRAWADRVRRVALIAIIPVVSAVAWLSMFYVIYGSFDPRAAYGPDPLLRPWIWGAVAGLFIDQQFGLMAYAPILLIALIGPVMSGRREWRLLSVSCLVVVIVYAMAVAKYWMWWAGVPGLPARFLTATVPLLSVPLAAVWARSGKVNRAMLLAVLVVSLGITAMILGVDRSAMAANFRDGQATWLRWLNDAINLPRAWPSFFWTTEAAFLRHAAIAIALVAIIWTSVHVIARRWEDNPGAVRLALGVLMPLAFMLMITAGWMITGTAGLNPARAQLAVHAARGAGVPVWTIGRGIQRWDPVATPIRIRQDEPALTDDPSTFVLGLFDVPAGAYRLDVSGGSLSGELTVRIGRSSTPLRRIVVAGSSPQSLELWLPAGAAVFNVEAENPALAQQVKLTLVTTSPARAPRDLARQSSTYPDGEAFFLDNGVVPEAEGFWVRAGRSTGVVLSQGAMAANRQRLLHLRNSGVANTVTLRLDAWQEVVSLAPGQERDVLLPPGDAFGAWPLTISSATGQSPSGAAGDAADAVGVWIR